MSALNLAAAAAAFAAEARKLREESDSLRQECDSLHHELEALRERTIAPDMFVTPGMAVHESLTAAQLQQKLRACNLPTGGCKKSLVARLEVARRVPASHTLLEAASPKLRELCVDAHHQLLNDSFACCALPVTCIQVLQLFVCALGILAALAAKHVKTAEHAISLYGLALALDVRPLALVAAERCGALLKDVDQMQLLQLVDTTAEQMLDGESLNRKAMKLLFAPSSYLAKHDRNIAQIVDGAAGLSLAGIASLVRYLPDDLLEDLPPVASPALDVFFIKPAGAAKPPRVRWCSGSDESGDPLNSEAFPKYKEDGRLLRITGYSPSLSEGRVRCANSATVTNPADPSKVKSISLAGMIPGKGNYFNSCVLGALDVEGLTDQDGMVRIDVSVGQPCSTLQLDALLAWAKAQLQGRMLKTSVHTPVGLCALATHLEMELGGAAADSSTAAAPNVRVADVQAIDDVILFHLAFQFKAIANSAEGLLGKLSLSLLLRLVGQHGVRCGQLALVKALAPRIATETDAPAAQLLGALSLEKLEPNQLRLLVSVGGPLHAMRKREQVRGVIVAVLVDRLAPAENAEPPPVLVCSISYDIFDDPVMLVGDGHTYSRAGVTEWLKTHRTSPITNVALSGAQLALVPNIAVRQLVAEFREKQPQLSASKRRRLGPVEATARDGAGQHAMALAIYSSWY